MAEVILSEIDKTYPNGFEAVRGLSLDIEDGEFLVLVGPSGCGKSTALRMIAGLEEISGGSLQIGDQVVNKVHPKDRDVAMVFQSYALYPHMTVGENIGFALRMSKVPKAERHERVRKAAQVLELEEQLDRKPGQLSGGQRQRVAMGRAIVRQPAAFLMDEPLSNLDAKLRVQMRAEISGIQKELGVTTIYVTHDQVEAMTMGDRVAVMKNGELQQVDSPKNLYYHPVNIFVAAFIGSPSMNLYEARLAHDGASVTFGSSTLALPSGFAGKRPGLSMYAGQPVTVGIRPEDMEDLKLVSGHPKGQSLQSKVNLVESLGAEVMVHFPLDAQPVDAGDPDAIDEAGTSRGEAMCVGRFGPLCETEIGEPIEVAVNTANLHFFDPTTGLAIESAR